MLIDGKHGCYVSPLVPAGCISANVWSLVQLLRYDETYYLTATLIDDSFITPDWSRLMEVDPLCAG